MSVNENQPLLLDGDLSTFVERAAQLAYEADRAEASLLRAQSDGANDEKVAELRAACEQAHAAMAGAHNDVFGALCRPPADGWRNKRDYFAASQNAGSRAIELIGAACARHAQARSQFHAARDEFLYGTRRGSDEARQGLYQAIQLLEESASQ